MTTQEYKEHVGSRVRRLRTALGLTQHALARAINIDKTAPCQWEKGSTLPSTAALLSLARLADAELGDEGVLLLLGDWPTTSEEP